MRACLVAHVVRHGAADEQVLVRMRRELEPECDAEVRVHARSSVPRGLHELAEQEQADQVVLGSSHRGRAATC